MKPTTETKPPVKTGYELPFLDATVLLCAISVDVFCLGIALYLLFK